MSDTGSPWAIIVHGGARTIAPAAASAHRAGCLLAVRSGMERLLGGGSALDAVEAAVRVLETDATFNAGYGAVLNAEGEVELDAAIMDGDDLAIGAVAAAQGLSHPVSVARKLLGETPTLLSGVGARRFAERTGGEVCRPAAMIASRERQAVQVGNDTVGCVALDLSGRAAVGVSTGGLTGKMPGRIGDSPIPGCGFYADSKIGGVCFSGDGESVSRTLLSARVTFTMDDLGPQRALTAALTSLHRVGGEAGGIALDRHGRFGCAHNSQEFAVGLASSMHAPMTAVRQGELREITSHEH